MGVYINMEMPKTGRYFVAVDNTDGKDKTVIAIMSEFERGDKTRPLLAAHELVPVPPHGRLIEAEPIVKYVTDGLNSGELGYDAIKVMTEVEYAPTIIPAEEGET